MSSVSNPASPEIKQDQITHVTIYGSKDCTYCKRAVMVCNAKKLPYDYKEIGKDVTSEEVFAELGEFRTVPQIVVTTDKPRHVGGFTEFYEYLQKN